MIKIDARGLACPLPVIKTKKALANNDSVRIIVDNEIATQNLKKLAEQLNVSYNCVKNKDTEYVVEVSKNEELNQEIIVEGVQENNVGQYIVVIDREIMGQGSDELGSTLMQSFVYSLSEQDKLPASIIFYNGGIKLAINQSKVIDDLKTLEKKGVNIFSCGACLDYYEKVEELCVGEITNMYRIVEMMSNAEKIIKP